MFNQLSPVYKGIVLALAGYSAYAVSDICVKWLTDYYPIYQILAIENAIAAGLLICFMSHLGGAADLKNKVNFKIHAMRTGLNFCITSLLTYCYKNFPIADVYAMIFTMPFFAALIGIWFYHEGSTRNRWIAIIIGFAGVVIAMRPGTGLFNPFMLLPLASAVLIALLYISTRSLKNPSIFSVGFVPLLGTALLSTPLAAMDFTPVAMSHIPVFALLSICACMGMLGVSLAFRATAAAVAAPFLYTEMIWALIFGWLLFNDIPDAMMLTGAAVIIASGLYLVETERRSERLLP